LRSESSSAGVNTAAVALPSVGALLGVTAVGAAAAASTIAAVAAVVAAVRHFSNFFCRATAFTVTAVAAAMLLPLLVLPSLLYRRCRGSRWVIAD